MSIKLGTLGIKPPYSKIYLGTLLKYQASGGGVVETEFTSCPFPTDWLEITARTNYISTNDLGLWEITASGAYSDNYTVTSAFDNNSSSAWRSATLSDGEAGSCCIICPDNVFIKPQNITIVHKRTGSNCVLKGYDPETEIWDNLCELTSTSTTNKTETFNISTEKYYSKFEIVVYRYSSTMPNTYIHEFCINSGVIKYTTTPSIIAPASTILLMHLERNLNNAIDNTVASTQSGVNYIAGKFGIGVGNPSSSNSISFNSTTNGNLPTYSDLANGTKALTVECWFKACQQTANTASSKAILNIGNGAKYNVQWYYDKFRFNGVDITVEADSPYNNWVHVAYVIKDGVASLFINGKKIASETFETDTSALTVSFGSMYGGQFDEILISTEALYTEDFTPKTKPYELG